MGFAPKFTFWFTWWFIISIVGIYTPNPLPAWFKYISIPLGIVLMIYGLMLNAIAGRTLKRYGHFDIRRGIRKPEKLVKVGIYSCMRHPAQFGSVFFGIGIALITSNPYAILLAGWYAFSAVYFILSIEERETLENFGDEYCEFLKTRKPFTFSPACLRKGIRALREGNTQIRPATLKND